MRWRNFSKAVRGRCDRFEPPPADFVSLTVVSEVEWLLRANYRLGRPAILSALRKFADLSSVAFEDPAILTQALDWAERGMDFADALHLARSSACEAFASFDRGLA